MDTCPSSIGASSAAVTAALNFFAATQCWVQEPWPPQATLRNESSFDFIIVGGGTAGSVLAARLSEIPSFSVLLIEAGGDPPQESIIPGFAPTLLGSIYDWKLTPVDDHYSSQALVDSRQILYNGKMLGGCGSHNSMIYSRGYPADYDNWASIVGDQWNWTNVLQYFKKTENLTDHSILEDPEVSKYHSQNGEIEVTALKDMNYDTKMFLEAFRELGYNILKDMTYPNAVGAAHLSFTIHDGRRHSTLTAILNKAAKRDNLYVLKDALVTRIVTKNKTAQGVEVLFKNQELIFYATKEVIVSAGTINTAKLLLLSGIGPKQHLNELGIEVVQDLPVGENFHDQPKIYNFLAAEKGTCPSDESSYNFNIIKYLYERSGSLSIASRMATYFSLKNSSTPDIPDFSIFPLCIPINNRYYEQCLQLHFKDDICSKLDDINKKYELIVIYVVLLKPKSRGTVKLNSTNPLDAPMIYTGSFSDPDDLSVFPEAIDVVRSITNTSYFITKGAFFVDLDVEECNGLNGSEADKCKSRALVHTNSHEVGTAAMGTVVDSRLRVKGVELLRIVDASVMPKIIRGHTNSPVTMIAEKAADFIKEEYKKIYNM